MPGKINKLFFLSALLLGFLILPCFANAQSLSLISDKTACKTGDYISVALSLDTSGKSINVVGGTVSFPKEFFDIQSIKTGDSFLTLWQKAPNASADGNITFSGGVPHGFNGSIGNVFSFILKAKKVGALFISVSNAIVLLNDGSGTKIDGVTLAPLEITITGPEENIPQQLQPVIDKISPLPFAPLVSQNFSMAENKFFVSFSTVDKETGIDYYEVREEYVLFPYFGPWLSTSWQTAETPYILRLQHWWSKIYVRAYDRAGNFRQEAVVKPLDREGLIILNILLIISAIILVIFAAWIYKRFKIRKK
jgi:hypothetical protein